MNVPEIKIVDYAPEYGREVVAMWRESFERAVGVRDPHPVEEQLRYLDEKVALENRLALVLDKNSSAVIGMMAFTPETIAQLYVHVGHQQRGIGSLLLDMAKENSSGRLRLFTFKANRKAQRFYERHGFKIIARGFEEQWQLEDIEYEWVASSAAS
ncbi:MAG: GNAT family N-acetyltransferase [Acidobacteria bacterium]|nr:GNAT family N-acetyltransferase [Acidobacteriota bacterium]